MSTFGRKGSMFLCLCDFQDSEITFGIWGLIISFSIKSSQDFRNSNGFLDLGLNLKELMTILLLKAL
ncbi:Uncharacterised protein [Chlamydia trachomatis]|nr:Uncharacterised protein [Chlamydia trachomatis]